MQEALNLRDRMYGNLAFGLGKDSEFRAMFNHHLIHMEEVGLTGEMRRGWLRRLEEEKGLWEGEGGGEEESGALGYDNILMPFVILGFGAIVAAGCWASEVALTRRGKGRKKYLRQAGK